MLSCQTLFFPQYFDALDLCVEHNVWVTEELAERFTLPKDEKSRNQILEKVAECAYAQENYKLATKKFTQAGNKVSTVVRIHGVEKMLSIYFIVFDISLSPSWNFLVCSSLSHLSAQHLFHTCIPLPYPSIFKVISPNRTLDSTQTFTNSSLYILSI